MQTEDEKTFQCPDCGKLHRDSDEVEVRSDGYGISVVCGSHAIWANRKAINDFLKMVPKGKTPK